MKLLKVLSIAVSLGSIATEIGKNHLAKKEMQKAVRDVHSAEIEALVAEKFEEMTKKLIESKS